MRNSEPAGSLAHPLEYLRTIWDLGPDQFMHNAQIGGYDAFGIAVTNLERIVAVALLYSCGLGAVLHSEMALYRAQQIPPIASHESIERRSSEEHKKAFDEYIA